MTHEPELGQMLFSNTPYTEFETPGYVTTGINQIDDLYAFKVEGKSEDAFRPGRTSNSGEPELVNEIFALRSYCWCDGGKTGHSDGCPPNFEHFASGFKSYWYKHSERGETCNREISRDEWRKIQRECEDWIDAQPKPYRVLVTGSREWAPELYVPAKNPKYKTLSTQWLSLPSNDRHIMISAFRSVRAKASNRHMVVIEGGANGADRIARCLAMESNNVTVETHLAKWGKKENGDYNPRAGFERNQEMVDSGADICLAFLKRSAQNRGTLDCVARAEKADIEVVEVWDE